MPIALPANSFPADGEEFTAYARCASLENRAPDLQNDGLSPLVCARLLGYLLKYAPAKEGPHYIAAEINSCVGDSDLMDLAELYSNAFIRCFKRNKGPTPAPSDHPSRPSFDNTKEALRRVLKRPPENHSTAKILALERDRFRCAITGKIDLNSYDSGAVAVTNPVNERVAETQAAHIFPPSTNKNMEVKNKLEYSMTVWTIMRHFGGVRVEDELNGNQIHRLENMITMDSNIHSFFDRLKIWLEPTTDGQTNTYRVKGVYPIILAETLPQVTFRSDDQSLPPPDPRYIALHAACAKVAHMSGAAEYIDMVMRDMEEMQVLADDGSSAGVLAHALQLCVATAA